MARPIKKGLDYFPVDFTLFSNRKFRKARQKYGFMAIGVYLSLLKITYSGEGYYIDYSDEKKEDILYEIQEDLKGRFQPTIEIISEVIETLVASELFSVDQYKNKIITSHRIQSIYFKAKQKSDAIIINPKIWILTKLEMFKLSPNNPILKNLINSETIGINSEETPFNFETTTQSKENKNKKNKSKSNESITANPQQIIDLYNENCSNLVKCTQLTDSRLLSILNTKFTIEELKKIFEKANSSSFLQGNNNSGFKASFDWIIKPNNALKILEGNYDNVVQKNGNQDRHHYTQEELDNLFNKDDEENFSF